jgi:FkbM family methyltransferase
LTLRGIGVLNSDSTKASGEEYLLRYIGKSFKVNTVIDVGANVGGYSQWLKTFIPDCTIYAIEPGPFAYKELKKIDDGPKMHTFNIGLSDSDGVKPLWDFSKKTYAKNNFYPSSMASVYREVIEKIHKRGAKKIEAKFTTLDRFSNMYKIKTIDFLKIDTEGSELSVLRGAEKLIGAGKIKIIQFEFNEMNVFSNSFMKDFIKLLKDYNLYRLMPNGFLPLSEYKPLTHELFAYQNIVAFHKSTKLP